MSKKIICPENCVRCWLSEREGNIYRCKFYGLKHQATLEEKPPYCKVKSITVEEEEILGNPGRSRQYAAIAYRKDCLLCGDSAEYEEFIGERRPILIRCPNCTEYRIGRKAIIHFFGKSKILNVEDKKRISEFLKSNYRPEKETIILTNDFIKKITGSIEPGVRSSG